MNPEGEGESLHLRDLLDTFRRRKWLILGITLLSLPISILISSQVEPLYRSSAMVGTVQQQDMAALIGGMADPWVERMIGSQLHLIKTRRVLGEAVDNYGLRLNSATEGFSIGRLEGIAVGPEVSPHTIHLEFSAEGVVASNGTEEVKAAYGVALEIGGVRFTVPQPLNRESAQLEVVTRDAMIRRMSTGVQPRVAPGSNIINVDYTDADRAMARRALHALLESFREISVRVTKEQAQRRRVFIEEQIVKSEMELQEALQALTAFRTREQVFNMGEKYAAAQGVLTGLELEREQLATEVQRYQQILAELQRPGRGSSLSRYRALLSSPGLSASPLIAQLYGQLVSYETEREVMTSGPMGSAPTNPAVQRLDALIASTESQLGEAIRSHIAGVQAQIASVDGRRGRNADAIQRLPNLALEEAQLVQRVEEVRARVNQLQTEHYRVQMYESVEIAAVSILDPPSEARPDMTQSRLMVLFGLLIGLALGGASAFAAEKISSAIRRREELEALLQVPVLGIIPPIPSAAPKPRSFPLLGTIRRGSRNGNGEPGAPASLIKLADLRSSPAEAFRTLRTNLRFSQAIQSLRSLVVTSALSEEGKSTIAANLAMAMAQQGMRVLLVGADLRRPRVERMFGVTKKPGLSDLLLEQTALEEAVHPTRLPGLDLLPCGVAAPNASELLGGLRTRVILETFAEQYDMVIIDTPPLLAGADAAVLGALADGVLMVVRAGATKRASAQQAMRQLTTVGARVVGVVLNDPDTQVPSYETYYGYHAKYYTEVEEEEAVAVR